MISNIMYVEDIVITCILALITSGQLRVITDVVLQKNEFNLTTFMVEDFFFTQPLYSLLFVLFSGYKCEFIGGRDET